MDRRALVTFQATAWSGWDREGYSIVTSAQLKVTKGMALSPMTLGFRREEYNEVSCLFYEVLVERIVVDRVLFEYRNLVMTNPDGTINLSGPKTGKSILRRGETMKLGTPTMDAGTSISVTLDEIH